MVEALSISVLVFLLLCAFVGDLLQYAVRIIVSILDKPNLSTHLVSLSMLLNRIGAALGLLIIGYFIDNGITAETLTLAYCVFTSLLTLLYLAAARFMHIGITILTPFIRNYYKIELKEHAYLIDKIRGPHFQIDLALVFSLALFGFLLPSIMAATFPGYRATLLQTGFLLNSLATIYMTLRIERQLALTLSSNNEHKKWEAYRLFMTSRAVGATLTTLILITVTFWM